MLVKVVPGVGVRSRLLTGGGGGGALAIVDGGRSRLLTGEPLAIVDGGGRSRLLTGGGGIHYHNAAGS